MQELITFVSVIVAGISGIAGILWSNQYKEAKQAQLDEKDTLIESLKELSPKKMRESYLSLKDQLEEYIDQLKSNIKDLEKLVQDLEENNSSLSDELQVSENIIGNLKREISKLKIKESEKKPAQEWLNNIDRSINNSKVLQVKSSGLQMSLRNEIWDMENVKFVPSSSSERTMFEPDSTSVFINPDQQQFILTDNGIKSIKNKETKESEDETSASVGDN